MCNKLLEENAVLSVFDPKVTREQMYLDLGKEKMDKMQIEDDPYLCCAGAHALPRTRHTTTTHPTRTSPAASHPPQPPPTLITALTLRPLSPAHHQARTPSRS